MNASEIGSPDWWLVVQTSPMYEGERLLKDYKSTLLTKKAGTPEYLQAGATVAKINAEFHRIAQIQNRAKFTTAVKNVYGQEGVDAVKEELARLEFLESNFGLQAARV